MKRSKFSNSHIVNAVKRVEAGLGVPDICREFVEVPKDCCSLTKIFSQV